MQPTCHHGTTQEERWRGTRQELIAEANKHFSIPDHPHHVLFRSIAVYLVQNCTVFDPTFPNGSYVATSAHEHEIVKSVNVSPFVWIKDVQQHGSEWFTVLEQAAAPRAAGKPPRHYVCLRLGVFEAHRTTPHAGKVEPDLTRDAWSHSRPLLQATIDHLWPGTDDDARFIRRALKELVDKGLVQWPLRGQHCYVPLPLKLVDVLSVSQILRSGVTRDAASVLLQQAGDYLMVGRLPGGNEKTLTLHMGRLQQSFLALEPLLVGGSLRNAFQPPLIPSSSAASLLPAAMQQPFSSVRPKSDVSMYSTVAAGSTSMTIPPVFPTMSLPLSQQQSASQILYRTNTPTQQQPRLFSNQPLDTTKLANAVASLSWQGGGFRNAPPTVQADTWVVGEPRAPRHTSRSNESPESSEGRHSQGSVPLNGWGHAAGHRIPSSSSSLTGNTNMQVLCMEQPQPGVMCKGANQQGVCVLSVLATQERVGVLLVSVPSDPPVCFSIPLEPMLLQPALAPNWIHTELTLLLADASVQKVLHNGRLVGGVLQLLQLSLGARVLDTRVLGLQLHAMYSACETVSPDGVMAAVTMDVEGALVHNGIQVTTPSPAEITALTIEQQQKPLQWAVCPAMPLQLLTASQEALATLLLAATLRQLVKTTAAGPWAESCSMRYAYGQRIVLNVANDGTSRH